MADRERGHHEDGTQRGVQEGRTRLGQGGGGGQRARCPARRTRAGGALRGLRCDANRGTVDGGASGDTAQCAVDALARWGETEGRAPYPTAAHLLILADGGGSPGYRSHLWTQQLQERLCDGLGLAVTVCPYPPGCSTWNPIAQRLFGPISLTWAGKPLHTGDTLLAFLRGTTTATGLDVRAERLERLYPTGLRVSPEEMATLNLTAHDVCPSWNYTITPRVGTPCVPATPGQHREVIV